MTSDRYEIGMHDLEPGLWIWRTRHPFWSSEDDYQEIVTSVFVESGKERIVIDPQAPTLDSIGLWEKLEASPPTVVVVTMPDHVRDLDMFAKRFRAKAYGPLFFFKDQVPVQDVSPVMWETELPGSIKPLYDARGRAETPLYIPEYKTIVFGDALTESDGILRIWNSPWHEKWEVPALREMLKLPFERVIVSHCDNDPVHSRDEFEKALDLKPFQWNI